MAYLNMGTSSSVSNLVEIYSELAYKHMKELEVQTENLIKYLM